ncbi:MAG: hypothetical protein ACRDSJ_06040 [Rubrobacteraceae bacterium]
MPEVLKLPELLQNHGEAQVYVRGRGVYAELYAKGLAAFQASVEYFARNDVHGVSEDSLHPVF